MEERALTGYLPTPNRGEIWRADFSATESVLHDYTHAVVISPHNLNGPAWKHCTILPARFSNDPEDISGHEIAISCSNQGWFYVSPTQIITLEKSAFDIHERPACCRWADIERIEGALHGYIQSTTAEFGYGSMQFSGNGDPKPTRPVILLQSPDAPYSTTLSVPITSTEDRQRFGFSFKVPVSMEYGGRHIEGFANPFSASTILPESVSQRTGVEVGDDLLNAMRERLLYRVGLAGAPSHHAGMD